MVQVYFLLVFLNLLAGALLAKAALKKSLAEWDEFFKPLERRLFKGVLGLATFLTGFFGLIFVLPGDQIFLGDLVPSIAALLSGTTLILEYYHKDTNEPGFSLKKIDDILLKNKVLVGLVSLAFGLIHFLSPTVIFL